MEWDPNCIFCKIVAGEAPCFRLYEDEDTLAFMDINPLHDGHSLVITKGHHPNLFETPDHALEAAITTVRKVGRAVNLTLKPEGINLVQANGRAAAQSVLHFHVHVIPRTLDDEAKLNWGLNPGDMDHIKTVCERIRENIGG